MTTTLQLFIDKLKSPRVVAAILLVVTIVALGASSVANASAKRYPDYFGIDKPGSSSICEGGSWEYRRVWSQHWHWDWGRDWGWFQYRRVWVPNWQKQGFETYGQCTRFVKTAKPTSRAQCRAEWWQLGFNNRSDCVRYLRLYGGGGYGG